jgi:type 1 glutamine amidotransferase
MFASLLVNFVQGFASECYLKTTQIRFGGAGCELAVSWFSKYGLQRCFYFSLSHYYSLFGCPAFATVGCY